MLSADLRTPWHRQPVVNPAPPETASMTAIATPSSRPLARSAAASAAATVRHGRRRMIDPTTCEREYDADELEFMQALDHYKRTSGRMFPTCSEVLEVLRSLGYQRVATN
jgi:hypothetical protein